MLIPAGIRDGARKIMAGIARGAIALKLTPNAVTVLGLVPAILGGWAFAGGRVRLGGLFLLLSGFMDMLDGAVARVAGGESKGGALLDSTIDRYAEIAVYLGLALFYRDSVWPLTGVILALCGSLMVSYVKARAEGLGLTCDVGMLQRPERLIILMVGAFIGPGYLKWAVYLIAVLANITALERLIRMKKQAGTQKP
ncbi:MAG: CDP-alcohol phosphatidyltransferase family protein [bacterium]